MEYIVFNNMFEMGSKAQFDHSNLSDMSNKSQFDLLVICLI